jgi:hypothetical protein
VSQPDQPVTTSSDRVPRFFREPVDYKVEERPGELTGRRLVSGGAFGKPGPDLGYALLLFERLVPRIVLMPGESLNELRSSVVACAMAQASSEGRAPTTKDLEDVLNHCGFLGGASSSQINERRALLKASTHNYRAQRALAQYWLEIKDNSGAEPEPGNS